MEVNIFAYDWEIILDDIFTYIHSNEWLFKDIIAKIEHLESQWWRGSWKNYKSLKDGVWSSSWVNVCEIKSNWPWKKIIRIFYHTKYNELILILDWMNKPEIYTSKKETKKVNNEYSKKIENCWYLIENFYNWEYREWKDFIKFNEYLENIGYY